MKKESSKHAEDRWNNEGGSQLSVMARSFTIDEIDASDRRILAFLGISVINLWDDLPLTARQKILNGEAVQAAFDKSAVQEKIRQLIQSGEK